MKTKPITKPEHGRIFLNRTMKGKGKTCCFKLFQTAEKAAYRPTRGDHITQLRNIYVII